MARNVKCKKCTFLESHWCGLVYDSPNPDAWRNCRYYKAATNADRIRAMHDEGLAKLLNEVCPPGVENSRDCEAASEKCYKCWLDWLRREAGT